MFTKWFRNISNKCNQTTHNKSAWFHKILSSLIRKQHSLREQVPCLYALLGFAPIPQSASISLHCSSLMLLSRYLWIAMADVPNQDPSKQHFIQFIWTLEIGTKKQKTMPVLMAYLLHILLNSRYYFWLNVVLDKNILIYLHNQCDTALPSTTIMAYFHRLTLETNITYDIHLWDSFLIKQNLHH